MNDESFIIIHPLYIHLRSSFQNTNPIAHKITFQLTTYQFLLETQVLIQVRESGDVLELLIFVERSESDAAPWELDILGFLKECDNGWRPGRGGFGGEGHPSWFGRGTVADCTRR
jgi:hypothetical protein